MNRSNRIEKRGVLVTYCESELAMMSEGTSLRPKTVYSAQRCSCSEQRQHTRSNPVAASAPDPITLYTITTSDNST